MAFGQRLLAISLAAIYSSVTALRASPPVNATRLEANQTVAQVAVAQNSSSLPFNADQPAQVGHVTTLYYNDYNGQQAQTISAGAYTATAREADVYDSAGPLPKPKCDLQLNTKTSYPTDNRKVNLRLASIAVCDYIGGSYALPKCGAGENQVCELMLDVPMPNSDEHQEPFIGAAMALAAYSRICELGGSTDYQCQVHRSGKAVLAGLKRSADGVEFKNFDVAGILSTELYDAYHLHFSDVYLAQDGSSVYENTKFAQEQHNVLHWQHSPPNVHFCSSLACLAAAFINHNR